MPVTGLVHRIDETEREEEEEEEQEREEDLTTPTALLLTLESLHWLCASEIQYSLRVCATMRFVDAGLRKST
jgi:hypothetical protein